MSGRQVEWCVVTIGIAIGAVRVESFAQVGTTVIELKCCKLITIVQMLAELWRTATHDATLQRSPLPGVNHQQSSQGYLKNWKRSCVCCIGTNNLIIICIYIYIYIINIYIYIYIYILFETTFLIFSQSRYKCTLILLFSFLLVFKIHWKSTYSVECITL